MSMPGFDYLFHCEACNVSSERYSIYPFHSLFSPAIQLPTWSLAYKFWGQLSATLTSSQRKLFETNHDELVAFAQSVSSEDHIVGVPVWIGNGAERVLAVTPEPLCPYCAQACEVIAYPDGQPCHMPIDLAFETVEEFRALPLSAAEFSVRTLNLLQRLEIFNLGQLEDQRGNVIENMECPESVIREIDALLAQKPGSSFTRDE